MKITITHKELLNLITIGLRYSPVNGIHIDDCKVKSFNYIKDSWDNEVQLTLEHDDKR